MNPTVGRIVHFREFDDREPKAAIVTKVWSPECVNVTVFHEDGRCYGETSVLRYDVSSGGRSWSWPPRESESRPETER